MVKIIKDKELYEDFKFKFKIGIACAFMGCLSAFVDIFFGNNGNAVIMLVLGLTVFNFLMVSFFVEFINYLFKLNEDFSIGDNDV